MKKVLLQGRGLTKVFTQGQTNNKALDEVDVDIFEKDFTIIIDRKSVV